MALKGPSSLTILIADDFADTRAMLKRMLEPYNYSVVEAADGEEAVELARRTCPSLILMDLNMPLMDGLAAAQKSGTLPGRADSGYHRLRHLRDEGGGARSRLRRLPHQAD